LRRSWLGGFLAGLVVLADAPAAAASGVEVALFTGPAFATYKQSFTFKGSTPNLDLGRLNVKESATVDAKGGISFGVSATLFLTNSFSVEARFDSVDVDLQSFGGSYTLELGPPGSPIPAIPLTLGEGTTDLRSIRPKSLNLRFQSQGRVGVGFSGGVSYVSKVDLDVLPTLTVANLNASIPVSLIASPVNSEETHHFGFNAGITLQVRIASGFSIVGEARGFTFKRSELKWEAKETGVLSAVEKAFLATVASQLELPRFTPGFWAARLGVAYRF